MIRDSLRTLKIKFLNNFKLMELSVKQVNVFKSLHESERSTTRRLFLEDESQVSLDVIYSAIKLTGSYVDVKFENGSFIPTLGSHDITLEDLESIVGQLKGIPTKVNKEVLSKKGLKSTINANIVEESDNYFIAKSGSIYSKATYERKIVSVDQNLLTLGSSSRGYYTRGKTTIRYKTLVVCDPDKAIQAELAKSLEYFLTFLKRLNQIPTELKMSNIKVI